MFMSTNNSTVPTYGDIYDLIRNGSTYTPQYQNTDGLNRLTSNYLQSMEPTWQATKNVLNTQYNASANKSKDYMSNMGLGRSGANWDALETNEQNRNNAIASAYGDMVSQAQTNALNAANLGLNEQNLIQTQKNNAINQLSNLLSQYQSNQYNEAQLTGNYNGQQTLAAQQLALQKQQYIDQLAAAIMAAYAEGTDKFTLPSSVTSRLNTLFAS